VVVFSPIMAIADDFDDIKNEVVESYSRSRDLRHELRELVLAAAEEDRYEEAIQVLTAYIKRQYEDLSNLSTLTTRQFESHLIAVDLLCLLRDHWLTPSGVEMNPELAEWLLDSPQRLELLVDTLSEQDDWPDVKRIIEELYSHDPNGRDEYFELILALAVVWDQPRRPLHGQIGSYQLDFSPQIRERYDYFKELYSRHHSLISYERLTVVALKFVVDTPVPVSELVWARENERGSVSRWGRKYSEIEYDYARLKRGVYSWNHGDYSLSAIREQGGLCVDQAYYAVMTARANGMPAMIFTGVGKRGAHAWIGHMLGKNRWEMDVGRYTYDEYMSGQTFDPQTDQPMTDHDIALSNSRAFRDRRGDEAFQFARMAQELRQMGKAGFAASYAEKAIKIVPILEPAWEVLEVVYQRERNENEFLELLELKADAFSRYPDELLAVRHRQAKILEKRGEVDEAQSLLSKTAPLIRRDRDDLARKLMKAEAELLSRHNRPEEACRTIERFILRHRETGVKLLPLIHYYLDQSQSLNKEQDAADFISRIVSRVRSSDRSYMAALIKLEIKAYQRTEDTRALERAERRLERL